MRIRELLACGQPSISFEFFPPKNDSGFLSLGRTLHSLSELKPTFVSVTYGREPETRHRTLNLVTELQREGEMEVMAHITCAGASRDQLRELLSALADAGVQNVLALRGDPAPGETQFERPPDGFSHANELAAFIRSEFSFCLGGACYPELHPEATNSEKELQHLQRKVEAGCEFLITQLFFDNERYYNFVAQARAAGIGVPIIPGIMPITNVNQIERFTQMCGATIPEPLRSELQRRQDDPNAVLAMGVAHATAQCLDLLQRGAPGVHFYTLNKSPATQTILMAIRTAYPPARTPAVHNYKIP